MSHLEDIPDDILGNILRRLELDELLVLQRVCRGLRDRIEEFGLPLYLSSHPQHHISLHPPASSWLPRALIRQQHHTCQGLRHRRWHALQIGPTWREAVIPTLSLSSSRLILGVGGRIIVDPLVEPRTNGGKAVARGREHVIATKGKGSEADIVGALEVGGDDMVIGQYDGTVQRFNLTKGIRSTAHYIHPKGSNLHTMAVDSTVMLTTTAQGLVSIFKIRSPWIPPFTLKIKDRAWSSLVATDHATLPPSLYLGMTGGISIYPADRPIRLRKLHGPEEPLRSSPYDMSFPSSPSAHHPSTLLSSWFDSYLRIHDLRTPSSLPVMEFFDPWQWADGSAIYSTTYFGEYNIAGGGARHGTVSLFDIRQPKSGWSIFSPNGKGSPVYKLKGDGGRLWGVTEKRAFMLAFDGSGNRREGMVLDEGRAGKEKVVERPHKWNGRGGKWGWTVRYDQVGEGCSGYDHKQSGVALFDSIPVV